VGVGYFGSAKIGWFKVEKREGRWEWGEGGRGRRRQI
jgi:hypothetical protein